METTPNKTNPPELPADIANAAQRIDEVLASLNKSREEHNLLAGHLRTIVSKILELMAEVPPEADKPKTK